MLQLPPPSGSGSSSSFIAGQLRQERNQPTSPGTEGSMLAAFIMIPACSEPALAPQHRSGHTERPTEHAKKSQPKSRNSLSRI